MEEKKNLCAPIPLSLHQRLRAEQEQRGQTLSDYITDILREHFEGGTRTMKANNRTIAFTGGTLRPAEGLSGQERPEAERFHSGSH